MVKSKDLGQPTKTPFVNWCILKNIENPQQKMKPGSKEKLRHREKSRILREVYEKKTTISKIKNDLDLNVSRETIRILTSSPYVSYEKIWRKPPLSKVHKLNR